MEPKHQFSEESYIKALLELRNKSHLRKTKYLEFLKGQYASENHTITATNLAKAAGYDEYGTANLHYGKMAHLVAELIGFTPQMRASGEFMWWQALSTGNSASSVTTDGHFEFVMRPELVSALETMRWVRTDS